MVLSNQKDSGYVGWIILIVTLVLGYMVSVYEEINLLFIILLAVNILGVAFYYRKISLAQITVFQVILGFVFIYSGLMKAIDPVGTEYRIHDYFIAFDTEWANPMALPLSVFLNSFEFVIGILLVLNVRIKLTSWLVLLMMSFFTMVTLNDALNNPVPDCGCFGDAIILSNWQTFYKNLVINAFVLALFLSKNKIKPWFDIKVEWGILVFFVIVIVGFQIFNIRHLPIKDFRAWKVGNNMIVDNPIPLEYYLTYRNIESGEENEYLSPNYPYDDSVWMAHWEFVSQRVVDHNPILHDLSVEDELGNDVTANLIENNDFQFILVSYDLEVANMIMVDSIRSFIYQCNENDISFCIVTSSVPENVEEFKGRYSLNTEFYYADDVSLKTIIRSNPGFLLMKEATVLGKWHYNDFPEFSEFVEDFVDN